MLNKKKLVKSGLSLSFLIGFWLSFASAANFHVNIEFGTAIGWIWGTILAEDSFSPVHFTDNWNDFGWFFYFSKADALDVSGFKIKASSGATYLCKQQVRWFYYNSERGERLWPLDINTKDTWAWSYDDLTVSWWIYTDCVKEWYDEAYLACVDGLCSKCEEEEDAAKQQCKDDCEYDLVKEESQLDACMAEAGFASSDNISYFWSVKHTYDEQNFGLIVWVEYTWGSSWISMKNNSALSHTFQRYDNKYPVGLVYDYNWWVGLVWCKSSKWSEPLKQLVYLLSTGASVVSFFEYTGDYKHIKINSELSSNVLTWLYCENIWSAWNTLIGMIVDGIVGMSKDTKDVGVIWNQTNDKMQYFSSSNINNATLINYVKQRAWVLCRWKWRTDASGSPTERVVCFDGSNNNNFNIDASDSRFKWKTLIVKNGNVIVKPGTDTYDIFVDSGDLVINETDAPLYVFNSNWFIHEGVEIDDFRDAVNNALFDGEDVAYCYSHGDNCNCMCDNGGETEQCAPTSSNDPNVLWCARSYAWEDVAVWTFLKWNFIVNGNVSGNGVLKHKYFVHGKMTTKLSANQLVNEVFAWTCESGVGSDGHFCPWSVKWREHPYQNASLILIDQNYDSPLLW